tara:strand:+ start:1382 stop:1555 length:174 start_codon:yes stop_codon:yes gene_type:complete
MSLRKMSAIVPEVMAEKAGDAGDLQVENQPVDPRKRVRRARRVRGGKQLELGLTITR